MIVCRSHGAASLPRPNWARPLPKRLVVSGVMTAATLNDVRVMIIRAEIVYRAPVTRTKHLGAAEHATPPRSWGGASGARI
jgi:hypothetical protein